MRLNINGTPISLLRLPWVASVGPAADRQAAVNSFNVVLPLLPVMPTTVTSRACRQAAPSLPSAARVSATTIWHTSTSLVSLTTTPAAPCAAAWAI